MTNCGYVWQAPYLCDPASNGGRKQAWVEQRCSLPPGHPGDHRSPDNVTAANATEKFYEDHRAAR